MKVTSALVATILAASVAAESLFEGLDSLPANKLVKRRVDSCGRPLRADWKASGPYSKKGGSKKGRACSADAPSAQAPIAPAVKVSQPKTSEHKRHHKHSASKHHHHKHAGSKKNPGHKAPSPEPVRQERPKPSPQAPKSASQTKKQTPAVKNDVSATTTHTSAVAAKTQTKGTPVARVKSSTSSSNAKRGLTWTVDNNFAPKFQSDQISWYLHFQDPIVPQMPASIPFVPTIWSSGSGPVAAFESTMAALSDDLPEYMLTFNEPDVASQANMNPQQAAAAWKQYAQPYAEKGVKVGAPSIAWDVDWLKQFFAACDGCDISFLSGHYYVGYSEVQTLKDRVNALHEAFPNLPLWVTEYGATTAGGGSASDILSFAQQTTSWLEAQTFVERVAFFGVWSSPPDGYVHPGCAFLTASGSLTNLGNYWVNS